MQSHNSISRSAIVSRYPRPNLQPRETTDPPMKSRMPSNLSTETVEGTTLALEGVDHVERCDGLTLGVLGVGDSIADD